MLGGSNTYHTKKLARFVTKMYFYLFTEQPVFVYVRSSV